MKTKFLILLLIYTFVSLGQSNKIIFEFDKSGYNKIGKQKLIEERKKAKEDSILSLFQRKLSEDELKKSKIISIPVFQLKNQNYECGDDVTKLINFRNEAFYQIVMLVSNDKHEKLDATEIHDAYLANKTTDSISLFRAPFYPDIKEIQQRIHKYILEHPDIFVFMIEGLDGYWAVIDGQVNKLTYHSHKIKGVNASYYICRNYGKEYLNDTIKHRIRTCYKYKSSCKYCSKKIHQKTVVVTNK